MGDNYFIGAKKIKKLFKKTIERDETLLIYGQKRGSGKTTVIDDLEDFYRKDGKKVIVCVDRMKRNGYEDFLELTHGEPERGRNFQNAIVLVDTMGDISDEFLTFLLKNNIPCVGFVNTTDVLAHGNFATGSCF